MPAEGHDREQIAMWAPDNAYGDVAEPACRGWIGEEVVGQECVEIEYCIAIEADLVSGAYQKFDSVLVVQDHLSFDVRAPLSLFAQFDQALGVERRVGVAFEAARIPSEID